MDDRKETSKLIEELLRKKDPALVGMKKILKKKQNAPADSSYSVHIPEVFRDESPAGNTDVPHVTSGSLGQSQNGSGSLFDRHEEQILRDSKQMLELETRIEELEQEIEKTRETSYEKGVLAGKKEAEDTLRQECDDAIGDIRREHAEQMAYSLRMQLEDREQHILSFRKDIFDLAVLLAEKIVTVSLEGDMDFVETSITRALSYLSGSSDIDIKVSSSEYERVKESVTSIEKRSDNILSVRLSPSDRIRPGGCLIETDTGIIDATVEGRLRKLASIVEESYKEAAHSSNHIESDSSHETDS
ncbi:MAG: FliH/SctL family protein [Fibrobacterota bacterium]